MKTMNLSSIAVCISAFVTFMISSCQTDEGINTSKEIKLEGRSNQNSFLYPPSAKPFGNTLEEWGSEYWRASYALDCEQILSPQLIELTDDVITYIADVGDDEVDITLSRHQALLLPLATTLFAYPCPEAGYQPAPGQTLEEFLQEGAAGIIDLVTIIELTFDGTEVENLDDYRFLSDLFYFTGNPEQAECYDPCITGEPQPGAYDGYMVMLKKMSVGQHTITIHGELPEFELTWDVTLNITVE
jgi:hypothetical protein